ncbi:hypothetical protein E3983_05855 [Legionella israelensis]|uniref:Tryptophan synthase subunit beta like protein n=1 Tax=Legionella israelensis TaxID=454 RepID=A0A0W0VK92_9GAMM|nr:hypothetical protein [Legionella israelensis]KTD20529.1 hypothetical protein Lisr_1774 [Legionella israelensis]QBR83911.1 hypothetical protein E3983_05855 [Legionella israelensis]QBS10795.1 hypothetical protein E4T55_13695 [Legionella israelensis]QDP72991.1 hypothetical protein FOG18_10655 [Legionella israelensis]SCY50042.1 hypothetical protein SAMN02746069_02665 [Legionella israelensis DSM 19235]
MVYVKRDKNGKIYALFNTKRAGLEEISLDNPELLDFFIHSDKSEEFNFLISDIQFIRVLEDLIDILIEKNIITITDFPAPVIEKLLKRQNVRKYLSGASGMEFDNDDNDETIS